MKRKLSISFLLFLPLVFISTQRTLIAKFNAKSDLSEYAALKRGAAIFSCDMPFRDHYLQQKGIDASCKLTSGKNLLSIKGLKYREAKNWKKLGAVFEFPLHYAKRFSGEKITVTISASCQNCIEPIEAIYTTRDHGNSDWRKFRLSKQLTQQSFDYKVPAREIDSIKKTPYIVLRTRDTQANILVERVTISKA